MRKIVFINMMLVLFNSGLAQTNVFPGTGNVGIGTTTPSAALQVYNGNGQNYFVNFSIPGYTEQGQAAGANFVLLHKAYMGTLMTDHFVMGKLFAKRGAMSASNRKWTVEVYTASAYNTDQGSIISYNEGAELVTLMYNNEKYIAAKIDQGSKLSNFTFTGYANNASLQLVYDQDVSDVLPFTSLDAITVQGNVGIGIATPQEKLSVNGNIRAKQIKVEATNWPDYVFDSSYQLTPLADLEKFIKTNKHLPQMPSAKRVAEEGLELGTNQALLLKKIEELTLHLISMDKTVKELKDVNNTLMAEIKELKK